MSIMEICIILQIDECVNHKNEPCAIFLLHFMYISHSIIVREIETEKQQQFICTQLQTHSKSYMTNGCGSVSAWICVILP